MSHCVIPNWNLSHQRQEQEGEDGNRSCHVHNQQNHNTNSSSTTSNSPLVPISNYQHQLKELKWENGQLAMHGLGGLLPLGPTKPTWGRTGDTLESIVHQATCHKHDPNVTNHGHGQTPATISSNDVGPFIGKWAENPGHMALPTQAVRKRRRSDSDYGEKAFSSSSTMQEHAGPSACASASATFRRESDTTLMTWASFESPNNLKSKTNDEDSASHGGLENQDEDRETKGECGRSNLTRRSRTAAIHNQSERRRRDRINQKMKALQKLVPNASKTDKASMLDEVIEYLKQLQAQVQMMNNVRNMAAQPPAPQMLMPLGMQQQLQMSLLARMGMAMGMGMLDMSSMARASAQSLQSPLIHPNPFAAAAGDGNAGPTFVLPPFMLPHTAAAQFKPGPAGASSACAASSVPLPDPCCALLAQSMNMELYNKMAALYSQQINQTTQATSSPSRSSHVQED